MPRYELMYIVSSNVSDDQIPSVTEGVLNFVGDFDGTVIREDQMGKKKLAYPIKKTRNGFYAAVTFEMPSEKINDFDTKVKTTPGIIRHLIVNIEEALERMQKDAVAQEKMNKNRNDRAKTASPEKAEAKNEGSSEENIDDQIEAALSEDLKNV